MIDIDWFKKVNDEFGHQIGDQVLKEFSALLLHNSRSVDKVARWGGEEFMIVCPES
jgi:diguanylate cyclase (GGDEF)-like protein